MRGASCSGLGGRFPFERRSALRVCLVPDENMTSQPSAGQVACLSRLSSRALLVLGFLYRVNRSALPPAYLCHACAGFSQWFCGKEIRWASPVRTVMIHRPEGGRSDIAAQVLQADGSLSKGMITPPRCCTRRGLRVSKNRSITVQRPAVAVTAAGGKTFGLCC